MTVYYDSEKDAIVENHPDYSELTGDGKLELHVDEMPDRKLGNLKRAVEEAIDAQED